MGGAADHLRRLDAGVSDALRPEPRLWVSLVAEHAGRDGAGRVERGGVCDWRRRECDLGGAVAGDGCCGQVVREGGAGGVCGGGLEIKVPFRSYVTSRLRAADTLQYQNSLTLKISDSFQ